MALLPETREWMGVADSVYAAEQDCHRVDHQMDEIERMLDLAKRLREAPIRR